MADSAVRDSVVVITGGTGSFGSTMARYLLDLNVGEVRILSRDEAKQNEMRQRFADPRLRFHLGDVRDRQSVAGAVRGADFVFHAASLKQVPSCEFFPLQAVRTNVLGSENVLEESAAAAVRSVVCLSTDKAVYPVNAMGMSKALMEKAAQAFARNNPGSATTVSVTRYGNVMCSRGSVIPIFADQIQRGIPPTITDPRMTRFLMSLAESVELVVYAFTNAEPGDLFVRKAPAATLEVLAEAVAMAMGVSMPEVSMVGVRHGEKLHESLLSREELVRSEDRESYFRVPLDTRSLDYGLYFEQGTTSDDASMGDYTSETTRRLDVNETAKLLTELPEFQAFLR